MSTPFYDLASLVVLPSGYKSQKIYAQKPLTTDGQLTFTRASTATRVNASGLIETVASGVPRLDYTNSSCPKILLEPQRSNVVLQSSNFAASPWFNSGTSGVDSTTLTANSGTAPDGTTTATLVVMTRSTTSGSTYVSQAQSTSAGVHASTIYLKAKDATHVGKQISAWQYDGAERNLVDITLTASWVRYSLLTSHSMPSGTNELLAFGFRSGRGTATSVEFYAWGGQGELGAYATSYIPTTSAAVTRLADSASKTGISSLIGSTAGTVFIDATLNTGTTQNADIFLLKGPGTGAFVMFLAQASGNINLYLNTAGIVRTIKSGNNRGQRVKIAISYQSGSLVAYVNGVQALSTGYTIEPNLADLYINTNDISTSKENTILSQFLLFKTALTNAQLAELSTL